MLLSEHMETSATNQPQSEEAESSEMFTLVHQTMRYNIKRGGSNTLNMGVKLIRSEHRDG